MELMRQELKAVQRKVIAGEDTEENEKKAAELEAQLDEKTREQKKRRGSGSRRDSKSSPVAPLSLSGVTGSNGEAEAAVAALNALASG